MDSEYRAATPHARQLKLLIRRAFEKLFKVLLTLDKERCTLVTGLITGHCTLRRQLHVTRSDNAMCGKCGQAEESTYHTLCQCPVLGLRLCVGGAGRY
jgi:hypothetical protein